jgi:hypothetical protein
MLIQSASTVEHSCRRRHQQLGVEFDAAGDEPRPHARGNDCRDAMSITVASAALDGGHTTLPAQTVMSRW